MFFDISVLYVEDEKFLRDEVVAILQSKVSSMGVSTLKKDEIFDINTLFKLADELMYKSKKRGRNKVSTK